MTRLITIAATEMGKTVGGTARRGIFALAWCVWAISPVAARSQGTSVAMNGAQATATTLLLPSSIALDGQGNLYIAETNRHDVLEVSPTGVVTVIAGTGVQGFSGDNGPATAAQLDSPGGVAVGADGSVYVADTHNQRIRRIVSGNIVTVAGTGFAGFGGDGGTATAAALNLPTALAVDSGGDVYIADTKNHRIRRLSGGLITTVAGSGMQGFAGDGGAAIVASLDSPSGIAVDTAGRIYIADTHNQRLRMVDTNGVIHTVAGNGMAGFAGDGGSAVQAVLESPRNMSVDAAGDLLFADSANHRIRMISPSGVISTLVGDGTQGFSADGAAASQASLDTPRAVTLTAAGNVVLSDTTNGRIREVEGNGDLYTISGPGSTVSDSVVLAAPSSSIYGSGTATAVFANNGPAMTGTVALVEGSTVIGSTAVTGSTAVLGLSALSVGIHSIMARYSGDALHPAAVSNTVAVSVAALAVTASVGTVSISYGEAVPTLSGTLSGDLPGDAANLNVSLSTTATAASPVGIYPIAATLDGSAAADYTLLPLASSAVVVIAPAATLDVLSSSSGAVYQGQPVVLTANVGGSNGGVPTGTVSFRDAGTVISTMPLSGGGATFSTSALATGTHSLTALYSGDGNFLGSSSAVLAEDIVVLPDFTVSTTGATVQLVAPGSMAAYSFLVQPLTSGFSSNVSFSASGLPVGATATFSPAVVTPGSSGASVTMTIQTSGSATAGVLRPMRWVPVYAGVMLLSFLRRRRVGLWRAVIVFAFLLPMVSIVGCGARTVTGVAATTYPITVTATATGIANTLIQHATIVSLTVN